MPFCTRSSVWVSILEVASSSIRMRGMETKVRAGKTTIVNLISRFYDATDGHVRIDGTDVRDVTLESPPPRSVRTVS